MDALLKSTMLAMDAVLGSTLPPAPRTDGEAICEDEFCTLRVEYRVNADDYCEAVRVFADFGGAGEAEIPIRCFSGKRLEALEASCAEDWDEQDDHPYARVRA